MSDASFAWDHFDQHTDTAVVRSARQQLAGELAQDLLGSKAAARRAFATGQLSADGRALQHNDQLAKDDAVELRLCRAILQADPNGPVPDVIYQDPFLLAVDKPAGLLVHGDGSGADTLTAQVECLLTRQGLLGAVQAVQRLDAQTTGLVIFSLAQEFQPFLDAQVAGHNMRKRYLAVVEGRMPLGQTWIELTGPIARDRHDARRMRVGATGKPAHTRVQVLSQHKGCSLLLVELLTGRKHQIRVHLAHAGHPILGDSLYGGAPCRDGLMLHALSERIVHPLTREALELQTSVPARFERFLEAAQGQLRDTPFFAPRGKKGRVP